jgi:Type II secretion system (T2SS), protein M subtype b
MIADRAWKSWKLWTAAALALLLVADLALVIFLWRNSQQDAGEMRADRDRMAIQAKLLRADVERGEKIRASLPQAGAECDAFYRESFLDAATGYSQIEKDLGAIATDAGVRTSGFTFKQTPVKDRGVTEISITTGVDADYPAIIKFINGLERSKNFYLLDRLELATASATGIRLELELHAFFRT